MAGRSSGTAGNDYGVEQDYFRWPPVGVSVSGDLLQHARITFDMHELSGLLANQYKIVMHQAEKQFAGRGTQSLLQHETGTESRKKRS